MGGQLQVELVVYVRVRDAGCAKQYRIHAADGVEHAEPELVEDVVFVSLVGGFGGVEFRDVTHLALSSGVSVFFL